MKYAAIIVLYNSKCTDSITLNNLIKMNRANIAIYVVDNSDNEEICSQNRTLCKSLKIQYHEFKKNKGLSIAYNYFLGNMLNDEKFVVFFDSDSQITPDFFKCLDRSTEIDKKRSVYVPRIIDDAGKIWSPNSYHVLRNHMMKDYSDVPPQRRFNAINSCTVVSRDLMNDYRFDESIFLDQVDTKFFYDLRGLGTHFLLLPISIHHDFSLKSNNPVPDKIKRRYLTLIPDVLTFNSRSFITFLLAVVKLMLIGTVESYRCKRASLFFWFISQIVTFRKTSSDHERK